MLKMNKLLVLIAISILILSLIACSGRTDTSSVDTDKAGQIENGSSLKSFTIEELKQYNGKDGNKAYIAVDGKVYDVTNSASWKGGRHNGYEAGADLTDEIKNKSPHGISKLRGIPVVGELQK